MAPSNEDAERLAKKAKKAERKKAEQVQSPRLTPYSQAP